MSMNKKWFERRWRDLGMSQNEVARRMGMSNPALSRMFSETRRMRPDEAVRLASILRVEVEDVLRASGAMDGAPVWKVRISAENYLSPTGAKQLDAINSPRQFTSKVVGWLDADGLMHEEGLAGPTIVSTPSDISQGCDALRFQMGPLEGWLVYFDSTGRSPGECVELLGLVGLADGRRVMRIVKRGFDLYNYVLIKMDGTGGEISEISEVRPVLWMKQRG